MSVSLGRTGVVQVSVSGTGSLIAAWFLDLTDGQRMLTISDAPLATPGAAHYIESWYRLNAVIRGRAFGVLLASEVAQMSATFAQHVHVGVIG